MADLNCQIEETDAGLWLNCSTGILAHPASPCGGGGAGGFASAGPLGAKVQHTVNCPHRPHPSCPSAKIMVVFLRVRAPGFSSLMTDEYVQTPYSKDTVNQIRLMAPDIKKFAEQYDVPPLAVAGSIAEEFDARKKYWGLKGAADSIQDSIAAHPTLERPAKWLADKAGVGWDLGPSNSRPGTAKNLIDSAPEEFPTVNRSDSTSIEAFSASNAGNAQLAAKYITWAKRDLEFIFLNSQRHVSDDYRTALYVDYFREGPETLLQKISAKALECPIPPQQMPMAYYGARAITNKQQLLGALSP